MNLLSDKMDELSRSISGKIEAHLIESIISLFNSGVLVHYMRNPRTTYDSKNYKMSVDAASGVKFEGREKIIKLEKEIKELSEYIETLERHI